MWALQVVWANGNRIQNWRTTQIFWTDSVIFCLYNVKHVMVTYNILHNIELKTFSLFGNSLIRHQSSRYKDYRRVSYDIYMILSWRNCFDLAIFLRFLCDPIFIPNRTFMVRFGGISDEFDGDMVRILARCSPAQIPIAKQN